jgi:dipeptidyl aminopeptidase/acylaminoacyl peptidase
MPFYLRQDKINLRMRLFVFLFLSFVISVTVFAQKKPLDHTVYDGWQSIGERYVSNNGKFTVYTIAPQEGDGTLVIQQTDGKQLLEVPRGYNARITEDNRYVVFKIKPTFQQTKNEAKNKRRATPAANASARSGAASSNNNSMYKDSLGIVDMASLQLEKIPRVKTYKLPEKTSGWLVYLLDKPTAETNNVKAETDSLSRVKAIAAMADSLTKVADSLRNKLLEVQAKGLSVLRSHKDLKNNLKPEEPIEEGTDLVIRNLDSKQQQTFKLVNDYALSKHGNTLAIKVTRKNGDVNSKPFVLQLTLNNIKVDTLLTGFNEAKNFSFDEEGNQLAFVAETDSVKKESQKFYKLYYYKKGLDSASCIASRFTKGVPDKWSISEFANITFSKSGKRLYLGTAPILPPKDTTLPEADRVSVDVWNYKDDNLMTAQLKTLEMDVKKNYLARYDFDSKTIVQLANEKFEKIQQTFEGDGDVFYTSSDFGKRVQKQWQGYTLSDVYALNPANGKTTLITKDFKGNLFPSYTGKYLLMYNDKQKNYFVYNNVSKKITSAAADIKFPLYDEESDVPDDPNPYGIAKWMQDDKYVLIYGRYDVWKVDPAGVEKSIVLTNGRKDGIRYRYANVDAEEKCISPNQTVFFQLFDERDKSSGIASHDFKTGNTKVLFKENMSLGNAGIVKAKDANWLLYSKETFESSPNLFACTLGNISQTKLSAINPQQANYVWGTAELFKWKAYTGKETEGILYKPENFDSKKKYPMIVYYYERNNNTLYNYQAPSPTPSRLNIPFFVSRGYVVFVPDIWYTTGHPGKSAYDYIVSGTRALIKQGFIDSTKLGLQGQSWGGYQTAYLITQTNLFAAAWAGAPVVNMFSAYGGIRWESGANRQMQYEKQQSRIGATIWQKPDLYIENSPLFHLPKVKTPLVIMSNDNDGAVPWYQGIEFFTAMRRLNKPVWLLNYNGEQHNLVERKNRKDIQIREQQFFDWLLKGDKPAKWITDGVPAVMKGRDWGLGTDK